MTMWNGHCRQKRGMRLKTSQGFFKGDWSPVEAKNQKYPSSKICRKVGFLCFLFLLSRVQTPGSRTKKEDCVLSARMGFVEVAGKVIHHRLQLER